MTKSERTIEAVIEKLKSSIASHEADLREWHEKFLQHPSYQFEWSEHAFRAAARKDVCTELLNSAEGLLKRTAEELIELGKEYCGDTHASRHDIFWAFHRHEAAGQKVRFSRSTSRTSNLIAEYRNEAWVQIVYGSAWVSW